MNGVLGRSRLRVDVSHLDVVGGLVAGMLRAEHFLLETGDGDDDVSSDGEAKSGGEHCIGEGDTGEDDGDEDQGVVRPVGVILLESGFTDVLHEIGERQLGELETVVGGLKNLLDLGWCDCGGQGGEVPSEMGNIGVDLDGGVGDDLMVVELSGTARKDGNLGDSDADVCLSAPGLGRIATTDGGGDIYWRVDQVFAAGEVEYGFFVMTNFHGTEGDGELPVLMVKSSKAGGVESPLEDSMLLADVELVVVLAVHQVGVVELQREFAKVAGEGDHVVVWLWQEGGVLVNQRERVKAE